MIVVPLDRVRIAGHSPDLFGEASDLGLPPGEWPTFIAVVPDWASVGRLTDGLMFQRGEAILDCHGEFVGYHYYTHDKKITLTVAND